MNKNKGIFIVVEGIDGAGKSTQIKNITEYISRICPDRKVILTREPGGTNNPLGEKIRDLLLNNKMEDHTRTLLYAASRYEHQIKIKKWLDKGFIVICDRYIYSSMAYQGYTEGQLDYIMSINAYEEIAIPDYVLHLDVSFDTYLKRKAKRLSERELDELEKKGDKFFKKNIDMYDKTYKHIIELSDVYDMLGIDIKVPEIHKIDSNKSIKETRKHIEQTLNTIFK